jgi:hypothetical protein
MSGLLIINSTVDVYVAGYGRKENGKTVATLWMNGKVQHLSDRDACANSVYASGNNLYVAGYERNEKGNYYVTALWKNGHIERLSDGRDHSIARSSFVYQNDIYVAGQDGCNLALWKNGIKHDISYNKINGSAYAIYVSNGDIYLAGYDAGHLPALWKNGYLQTLTTAHDKRRWISEATSVYVYGEDVYVAGYEDPRKDTQWITNMSDKKPILWKNGVSQILTTATEGYSGDQIAHSVYVYGNDVYVAGVGVNRDGKSVAVLWKNGRMQRLSNGNRSSIARSIFVK